MDAAVWSEAVSVPISTTRPITTPAATQMSLANEARTRWLKLRGPGLPDMSLTVPVYRRGLLSGIHCGTQCDAERNTNRDAHDGVTDRYAEPNAEEHTEDDS
jgi:hypothetical protein